MTQNEFDNLLEKYLKGDCTPQEELVVLEWYSRLKETSELALSTHEKDEIEDRIWNKISTNLFVEEKPTTSNKIISIWSKKRIYKISVAASLLFVLGTSVFYFLSKSKNSLTDATYTISNLPKGYKMFTNNGIETKSFSLPDGSLVKLKTKSVLFYPSLFVGETRDVYLQGSAFFDVTHNPLHHFIVHSNAVETEVLGTSFEITKDSKTNKIEVAVSTGKVSVYEKSKKLAVFNTTQPNGIVLVPNQKATYNPENSQFVTTLVDEPQPLMKLENKPDTVKFSYQEATLKRVFAELQSAYGITINTEQENIKNCHFTGDITKQDLYKKLDIVCQSTQASYELKGTTIFIKGNGCK